MKKSNAAILAMIAGSLLASCGNKTYSISAYKKELEFRDGFRIVQLTDIHFGIQMDVDKELRHLDEIVERADNPDLLVLTGDTFMDANKNLVKTMFKHIDSYGLKWAITFGNHDRQGDFPTYYLNEVLETMDNCLNVDYRDDNLHGTTNYFIDLKEGIATKYRLYIIDSGTYHLGLGSVFYGYDVIHKEQMDHVKAIYENDPAPGLAFFHIPLKEFQTAYDEAVEGLHEYFGVNNEACCPGYENQGQYDVFKSCDVRGLFVGHDHINNSTIDYKGEMLLSYGMKTTDLIYNDPSMIGYKEIILPSDPSTFGLSSVKNITVEYHD